MVVVDTAMHNTSDEILHDFTVKARCIVEETIDRKLTPPKLSSPAQNPTEAVVRAIVGRNSIRSTVRRTGIPQNQVKATVVAVGDSCARLHRKLAQNLTCRSLQCDARMVLQEKSRGQMRDRAHLLSVGSAWTWTSIDVDTRFVLHWLVAPCNAIVANSFLNELAPHGPTEVRVTVNGRRQFEWRHNGSREFFIDDEGLERMLGPQPKDRTPDRIRSLNPRDATLDPWLALLSEGFVRKVRRHSATLALLFTYHNFASADADTGISPAMAAGITDHLWPVTEIVEFLNQC
jgi:hypothetical protein